MVRWPGIESRSLIDAGQIYGQWKHTDQSRRKITGSSNKIGLRTTYCKYFFCGQHCFSLYDLCIHARTAVLAIVANYPVITVHLIDERYISKNERGAAGMNFCQVKVIICSKSLQHLCYGCS